MLLGETTEYFI